MKVIGKLNLSLLLMFFFIQKGTSQVKRLSIGDSIPDIEFSMLYNFDAKSFRISDLRNKNVIIDVWNKGCSACISLMTKIEDLQSEFKDDIVFITMTSDTERDYLILKKKSRILKEIRLKTIVEDTILHKLIPPPSVPFYIWIGKGGILKATSNADHLTKDNLKKFVAGNNLGLEFSKKEGIESQSGIVNKMIFNNRKQYNGVTYYSMLREENSIIHEPLFLVRSNIKTGVGYDLIDNSLISLYKLAYGFEDDIDVTLSDSTIDCKVKMDRRYSYFIRFEPDKRPANVSMLPYLRRDLQQEFKTEAKKVVLFRPVYVLKNIPGLMKPIASNEVEEARMENASHGIFIKNAGIRALIQLLKVRLSEINGNSVKVIDETNIKYNFDLNVSFAENNISGINAALKMYGIKVIKSMRMVETLVLSPCKFYSSLLN